MKVSMITTIDNPFDPFTQFDEWYAFDISKGYFTCSYLARIAVDASEISYADANLMNELAIDEIVEKNPLKIYKKITKEIEDTTGQEEIKEGEGGA